MRKVAQGVAGAAQRVIACAPVLIALVILPSSSMGQPSDAPAALSPGERLPLLIADRELERARTAAEQALVETPTDARAFASLLTVLARTDRDDEAARIVNDVTGALALLGRGMLAGAASDVAAAESLFVSTRDAFVADGDPLGEMIASESLGLLLDANGRYEEAVPIFTRAIAIADSLGRPVAARISTHALGQLLGDIGRHEEAISYLERAVSLSESLDAPRWIGQANLTLSTVYRRRMDLGRALGYRKAALTAYEAAADTLGQARCQRLIGVIHLFEGEFTQAIERLQRAKAMAAAVGNRREEGICLGDLGSINYLIGDYERAIPLFEEAIRIGRDVFVARRTGGILGNIATALTDLGRYEEALARFEDALAVIESGPVSRGAQQVLNNMGRCLCALERTEEGVAHLERAAVLAGEWGDVRTEVTAVRDIGLCRLAEGDLNAAGEALALAAERADAAGYYETSLSVLQGQALLAWERGHVDRASELIGEAVDLAESVRFKAKGSTAVQSQFFGHLGEVYDVAVEFLHARHERDRGGEHASAAFDMLQRAKARAFLDLLTETSTDLRLRADPAYREREQSVLAEIAALLDRRSALPREGAGHDAAGHDAAEADRAEIDSDIAELEQRLAVVESEIRALDPAYAAIVYPRPLTLRHLQKTVLEEGELLLDYLLGDRASFVFAITRTSFDVARIPAAGEIERDVRSILDMISDYNVLGDDASYFVGPAARLSSALLGEVMNQVRGAERIIVSPDGALHYLPFEVLLTDAVSAGESSFAELPFLVLEAGAVVRTPSISALAELRAMRDVDAEPALDVLLVGDPIIPADNTGSAFLRTVLGAGAGAVPEARREVEAIQRLYPADRTRILLGDDAAPDALRRAAADGPYGFVHIVAHGVFNERRPQFSGLALSADETSGHDGFFGVADVFALDLPCRQVVLSACSSALGEAVSGEGLIGLTRGFLYAGAGSVVAALWEVSGGATATSMARYYETARAGGGSDLAFALAEAKRGVLRDGRVELGGRSISMAHPFFWAPFVLIGDG